MTFKTKLELAVDIIHQQPQNGVYFDYVGGDGYYGNNVNLAGTIDQMGYIYMLDIHSDQRIFINQPELFLSERKSTKGPAPKRLKASTPDMSVSEYMESLLPEDWEKIQVRNTTKGKLIGEYHFVRVYIWNKSINQIEPRMLVIRKTMSAQNTVKVKYSFTNTNLEQYTHQGWHICRHSGSLSNIASKNPSKYLGLDQFQTRKWLAWQHQVGL